MSYQQLENLSNTKSNSVNIGAISSSSPRRYHLSCDLCGSQWEESHAAMRPRLAANLGITCKNTGCTSGITATQAREKDYFKNLKQRERDELEAATEQRNRERYGLKPEPAPIAAKAPAQTFEAVTAEFENNARAVALAERQNIIAGLKDDNFVPDPLYDNATIAKGKLDAWNNAQADLFMASTPSYYATEANSDRILDYLEAHGVTIVSAESFRRAYERLSSYGLLETRPPEPEPVELQPDPLPSHHEGYAEPQAKAQPRYDGIDPETGESRSYSEFQVRGMTSDVLRRTFSIPSAATVYCDKGRKQ